MKGAPVRGYVHRGEMVLEETAAWQMWLWVLGSVVTTFDIPQSGSPNTGYENRQSQSGLLERHRIPEWTVCFSSAKIPTVRYCV